MNQAHKPSFSFELLYIVGISLTCKQWILILWSGIALGLHFLLWMGSLRLTTVASSTVIMTLEPILVMLGSFLFFRMSTNRVMLIGMGLAFVGSLAIRAGDFHVSGQVLLGDTLSFLGMLAVIHMLIGKHLREHLSAFVYNFWVFAIAATSLALYNVVNAFYRICYTGMGTVPSARDCTHTVRALPV